ncbi:hypothetical protein ACFW2V_36080 [Streptomyces sp. NPDC058947]|uniref:hypothetical protein n=1 Tax=Streptomyces sp. NPDC058947 TaxID=3346675 RepID=UPI00367D5EE8
MNHQRMAGAPCVQVRQQPLTWPELIVVVVVLILAIALVATGMPSLAVFVLLGESCSLGIRFIRRLRQLPMSKHM